MNSSAFAGVLSQPRNPLAELRLVSPATEASLEREEPHSAGQGQRADSRPPPIAASLSPLQKPPACVSE